MNMSGQRTIPGQGKLKIISEMLQKMDWYQGDMEDEKDEE